MAFRNVFEKWNKPFLIANSSNDPVTGNNPGITLGLKRIPTANEIILYGPGHFVQEEAGPEYAKLIIDLINQLPEEEISYPFLNNEYKYYQKTSKNDQLPRYYRKSSDGEETLYLDPNIKLKNQDYYNIGSIEPSPNNNYIAYLEDNNGRREYDVKIINASNLDIIDDGIKDSASNIIWSRDSKFVIYLKKDPLTLINDSVYIHRIGSSSDEDKLLYKEIDQEYNLGLYTSKSEKYAYIEIDSSWGTMISKFSTSILLYESVFKILKFGEFRFERIKNSSSSICSI